MPKFFIAQFNFVNFLAGVALNDCLIGMLCFRMSVPVCLNFIVSKLNIRGQGYIEIFGTRDLLYIMRPLTPISYYLFYLELVIFIIKKLLTYSNE